MCEVLSFFFVLKPPKIKQKINKKKKLQNAATIQHTNTNAYERELWLHNELDEISFFIFICLLKKTHIFVFITFFFLLASLQILK